MSRSVPYVLAAGATYTRTGEECVVSWDGRGPGESLPDMLEARLPRIRAELVARVYELGRMIVRGKELQEYFKTGDSLSMWWCSLLFEKHPKMLPGLYEALKLRALELVLEEESVSVLHLAGGDAKLSAALTGLCRERGIAFTRSTMAHKPKAFSPAALYHALPAPLRAAVRFAHWLLTVKRRLPRTGAPSPASGPAGAVAVYFPNIDAQAAKEGRFRSCYWETLHEALETAENRIGVNWLFIMFPSPQYTLRQCIDLARKFRAETRAGASFHYLEEFLGIGDIFACLVRWSRLLVASLRTERAVRRHFRFQGSRLDLWPWLGWAFADSFRGWRALERCLQRRACIRWTEWCGPQNWTIFPLENCPWERMLTQAVHEAGNGPVYGAQHSTVRATDFRYFDDRRASIAEDCRLFQVDRIFVNGAGALEAMRAAGYEPESLGMLEALRYMYLAAPADAGGRAEQKISSAQRERLLVLTSFFSDETDAQLAVLTEAATEGLLRDLDVFIKPHPCLGVQNRLTDLFPQGNAPEITTVPVGKLLLPGTLVWTSNSTTAALEAALLGLPVMVQAAADDFDLCPLQGVSGLARIRNVRDLARALAAPSCPRLPQDYLMLDPALPRWRALLGLL